MLHHALRIDRLTELRGVVVSVVLGAGRAGGHKAAENEHGYRQAQKLLSQEMLPARYERAAVPLGKRPDESSVPASVNPKHVPDSLGLAEMLSVALLANPDSGSGDAEDVADCLREQGLEVSEFALDDAQDAVVSGPDCLVVAGGDGSLACVAAPAARPDSRSP